MTQDTSLFLPAEWYPQDGIQLTWPHKHTDWAPYLEDITNVFIQMAKIISEDEYVIIASQFPNETAKALSDLAAYQLSHIIIYKVENDDTWARDHGGITLLGEQEEKLLDFTFNGWGNKFHAEKDNKITHSLYEMKAFSKSTTYHSTDFVLEGGSIESDGKGCVFTTSQCLLAPNRNQPMTREDIEKKLLSYFSAKRIVWFDYGNLVGDDTDGHIDTIVRLAPNDSIVYVGCDNSEDEQFEDFQTLEKQIKELRTSDNKMYNLYKLPMPDAIYDDGDRLPATYANFVITNKSIICPTYGQPENDNKAMNIIGKAFPNHRVIGVDSRTVIRQHGSLHCLTMQYPKGSLNI